MIMTLVMWTMHLAVSARCAARAACAGAGDRGEVAIDARAQYEWMNPLPLRAIRTINGPHVAIDTALIYNSLCYI